MRLSSIGTRLLTVIRWVLGLALLLALLSRLPADELLPVLSAAAGRRQWWSAGLAAVLGGLLLGAARWHLVLQALQLPLRPLKTLRIFFIGIFFNAFLPGACGGDLVRACYTMQAHPARRGRAIFSVLLDRAVGLGVLLLFTTATMMFFGPLGDHPLDSSLRLALLPLAAIFLAAVPVILVLPRKADNQRSRGTSRFRAVTLLRGLGRAGGELRERPGIAAAAVGLSLGNILALALACACFARALGAELDLRYHLVLFPAITLMLAVPLTPGALGVREGLFAAFYGPVGLDPLLAVPLSLLVYSGGLFWGIAGGVLFLLEGRKKPRKLRETVNAIRQGGDALNDAEASPGAGADS